MAVKRMFSNLVIDNDIFLDLPLSAQALYFHLGLKADDDGFLSCVRRIMKTIGAAESDLSVLLKAGFLIEFPQNRVYVVRHFRINNDLKTDRYHPTLFQEEFSKLTLDSNKIYNLVPDSETDCLQTVSNLETDCLQGVSGLETENRLDKNSIDKNESVCGKLTKKFIPPSVEEVSKYAESINKRLDAQRFCDYYEQRGWTVGKGDGHKMKSWQAAVRMWDSSGEIKQEGGRNNAGFNAGRI